MAKKIALIVGVGEAKGLGASLCRRAASDDYHVVVVGRTAEKIEKVAAAINQGGGAASIHVADVTDEAQVMKMFEAVDALPDELDCVVSNVGNAFVHDTLTMPADFFEQAWRIGCYAGFLIGREAGKRLAERGQGTILFTGATASLKSRGPFVAFASAKAGLRAVAGGLARDLGPHGVHIGHVIVDGIIDGEQIRQRMPDLKDRLGPDGMMRPDAIAESFWQLHLQDRSAWTFELDLRPFKESF